MAPHTGQHRLAHPYIGRSSVPEYWLPVVPPELSRQHRDDAGLHSDANCQPDCCLASRAEGKKGDMCMLCVDCCAAQGWLRDVQLRNVLLLYEASEVIL